MTKQRWQRDGAIFGSQADGAAEKPICSEPAPGGLLVNLLGRSHGNSQEQALTLATNCFMYIVLVNPHRVRGAPLLSRCRGENGISKTLARDTQVTQPEEAGCAPWAVLSPTHREQSQSGGSGRSLNSLISSLSPREGTSGLPQTQKLRLRARVLEVPGWTPMSLSWPCLTRIFVWCWTCV